MFHDLEAEKRFYELQQQFRFPICFETGGHLGYGTSHISRIVRLTYTIEINPIMYAATAHTLALNGFQMTDPTSKTPDNAIQFIKAGSEVWLVYGSSDVELRKFITPSMSECPVCFYLDAHWQKHWPLCGELQAIAESKLKNCVIIIPDIKNPNHPEFSYDSYGGQDLDFDYVKDLLLKINPNFHFEFNNKCDPKPEKYARASGILYCTP